MGEKSLQTTDRGLISRTYKELQKFNSSKNQNQNWKNSSEVAKDMRNEWTFFKREFKWLKDVKNSFFKGNSNKNHNEVPPGPRENGCHTEIKSNKC